MEMNWNSTLGSVEQKDKCRAKNTKLNTILKYCEEKK